MNDNVIHEKDLIQLDGTADTLAEKLRGVITVFQDLTDMVQRSAASLATSVSQINTLSDKGRQSVESSAASADRLARAQSELEAAMSETSRSLAELKAQTATVNRENATHVKYLQAAEGSYNEILSQLKQAKAEYKALSAEERDNSESGQVLLEKIRALTVEVRQMDAIMKPHIQGLNELAKIEQELAFLETEEGKATQMAKRQLAEKKRELAGVSRETRQANVAQRETVQISQEVDAIAKKYGFTLKQTAKYQKLTTQLARAQEGSFEALQAEYDQLWMKIKKMTQDTPAAAEEFNKATMRANDLMKQMVKIQEATGRHTLRVGDYRSAWDGLGISVNQIVRELPSAAMSLNTFFVAISNNIPILMDEINKTIAKNKILQEQGLKTIKIGRAIARAIFSWNTVIVLIVTSLSMFGKEIMGFIGRLLHLNKTVLSTKKALKNIAAELENNNASYGQNVVLFTRLRQAFSDLKTTAEKQDYLEKYKDKFDELGASVSTVNDLEKLFSEEGTEAMIKSLRKRARAAAAVSLAEQEYEKAFVAQAKADAKEKEMKVGDKARIPYANAYLPTNIQTQSDVAAISDAAQKEQQLMEIQRKASEEKIRGWERESAIATNKGDVYMQLLENEDVELDANTKAHKNRAETIKDLTEKILKMQLEAEKKYQDSFLAIQEDSYAKERMALVTANEQKNDELMTTYKRNLEWLKGSGTKYKALTKEQVKTINEANQEIRATIENNDKKLADDLLKLAISTQIKKLRTIEQGMKLELDAEKEGSVKAGVLRIKLLENQRDTEIAENRLKTKEEQQDEEAIRIKYTKQIIDLQKTLWNEELSSMEKYLNDRLSLVKKNSSEELAVRLALLEVERKQAIIEDDSKDPSKRRGRDVINKIYENKSNLLRGSEALEIFKEQQELETALFNITKKSSFATKKFELEQEKNLARKKLELYQRNQLDLSDTEVKTLKATIAKIDNELKTLDRDWTPQSILSRLGFDDESFDALKKAVDYVVDQIKRIIDVEIELRQKQVEAAKERTEAAKAAYDAEIEARNNGYANNVETTKKELMLAKEKERQKEKMLKEAQDRAAKLDSITQASSLLTASAEIFKSLSGIPVVGPALAIAAIGTMWATFATAKIKAKQVSSQEYGEGGLEIVNGGSHSSGHDVDLGVTNKRGKRMRVEGGEAIAVINKRRTRQYSQLLPSIISSLNLGTFERDFGKGVQDVALAGGDVDLTNIEESLRSIKEQGNSRVYNITSDTIVIERKNVRTIIHK